MNVDKAYLIGLVIGGGIFGSSSNSFHIRLPFKQWGSIEKNPKRAGQIANDILKVVKPMLKGIYNLDASYATSEREWNILCDGDLSELKNDLVKYGVMPLGELRKNASIEAIVPELVDDNMKRRFIAGLADTIGSTTKSHRRFTDDIQIISFEISGFRFDFVCQLCRLLYSIKCYPDQILWNHPNFHSTMDPYYESWKKGFKLRVQLDQYAQFGAFAFKTKAESANENRKLQSHTNSASPCATRDMNVKKTCVHLDEGSTLLPECIRGGHYLHNKHVCAVLGCEYAPYEQVDSFIKRAGYYINPFPIMHKGSLSEVHLIIHKYPIYSARVFSDNLIDIAHIYKLYKENHSCLLYGNGSTTGYPLNIVIQGLTFIIAANMGLLNGNRPRGNQEEIIENYLKSGKKLNVVVRIPDKLTALLLECGEYAVMIGAENPSIYGKLVSRNADNKYKLGVRAITEEDLDGICG